MMPRLTLRVADARRLASKLVREKIKFQTIQQAGWGKSGSKLRALKEGFARA